MHNRLREGRRREEWVLREKGAWIEMVLWLRFSGAVQTSVTESKERTGPRTA